MACLTARVDRSRARLSSLFLTLLLVIAKAASPGQSPSSASAGPIDFESHGMHYEALTKNGITVMFAPLPPHVKDYNIVQVTVTNGSPVSWTVKPNDFS